MPGLIPQSTHGKRSFFYDLDQLSLLPKPMQFSVVLRTLLIKEVSHPLQVPGPSFLVHLPSIAAEVCKLGSFETARSPLKIRH